MFRSIGLSMILAGALCGCRDDTSLREEQSQEQQALKIEQARERAELEQEQAREREAAARVASARLEAVEAQRSDMTAEARQLEESVALACQGTPTNIADTCPIDRRFTSSTTTKNDGILIHLSPQAGTEAEFERRIDCYRARASLRAASAPAAAPAAQPTASACVFDLADVDVDVTERDGHVVVDLTSSVRARVEDLKAHARQLTASAEAAARAIAHN